MFYFERQLPPAICGKVTCPHVVLTWRSFAREFYARKNAHGRTIQLFGRGDAGPFFSRHLRGTPADCVPC